MGSTIKPDSLLLIVDASKPERVHLVPASKGKFTTQNGELNLEALVGKPFGVVAKTHMGAPYIVLSPTLYDVIMHKLRRLTQIVYPKESGYIVLRLGLKNGMRVFECGAGSGAMTVVLANAVAPDGEVVSYERDKKFLTVAKKNVTEAGLSDFVRFQLSDMAEGIEGGPYDAAFVDVREPWLYLESIWASLVPGAPLAMVLPTANQIISLLEAFERFAKFACIEVEEILLRRYKPVSQRLRPTDRMVAHTAYIIFARKVVEVPDGGSEV